MHERKRWHLLLVFILLALASVVWGGWAMPRTAAFSANGGEFGLGRWTLSVGGGISQGGDFTVAGSAGLVDAGGSLSGGEFNVRGGFWSAPRQSTPANSVRFPYLLHNAQR